MLCMTPLRCYSDVPHIGVSFLAYLVHLEIRSVLVLLEKLEMGEVSGTKCRLRDGVQLNSYVFF